DVIQLDNSFSYGVQGSWESSEPDALSNDGKVVFKTYEQSVVLTLTLSFLDEVKQFDYIITISAIENSFEFLEAVSSINIPLETKNNIYLPSTVNINNEDIILEYNISKPDIISYDGIINRDNNDEEVLIVIKRILENRIEMIEKNIVVLGYDVEEVAELFDLGIEETYVDIELPSSFMGYEILWLSYNEDVISSSGKYSFVSVDTEVTLSALFAAGSYPEKEIKVIAKPIPDYVRLNMIINTIEIPEVVGTNLNLETVYDYSVTGEWTSSDEGVITTDGIVYLTSIEKNVTLSLTLYSGEETLTKLFIVKTIAIEGKQVMGHNYQDYAKDYNLMSMVDVHLEDERLVLDEGKTTGTYVSSEFNTIGFERLVASWAAISSMKGTVEIEIKVKVDGIWSKYFSYQKWGLGLQNKSIDSSDSIAKLSTDEVVILNSKTAVAYQYKVTLRRNASLDESPKLLLVAVALTIPNYTYPVDTTGFPDFVDYDVPLLNQNEVPVIGNSICSITSSTMLLKYKGHNFEEYDSEYEHRYIAGLFKDYGANIYGNWVYNTVGMSAYGEETFVNKMYSFAELQKHLLEVGPISASVKGNMGLYTTAGHLIVVRGYRITNGQTYVITNDPNINSRFGNDLFVYYEYPLATFINVWRGVNYIIK
ncbi:MAG: C39 family peptidase, partial [Bacilli bacterium]